MAKGALGSKERLYLGLAPRRQILLCNGIPHDWLFPQLRAVVHHGGAGTTAMGLYNGLPTGICGFFADQFLWGTLLEQRGCGRFLPASSVTLDKFHDMLQYLTSAPAQQT